MSAVDGSRTRHFHASDPPGRATRALRFRAPEPRLGGDSPAVESAKGHVETFEDFSARERTRLENGGPYPVSEEESRRQLRYYEERLSEWRKALDRAEREAVEQKPLA